MSDNAQETTKPFLNPYNFVPFAATKVNESPADSHACAGDDLLYGSVEIEFETITPLLVADSSSHVIEKILKIVDGKKVEDDHIVSGVRRVGGRIDIPPASIKGALRAAHEAVTGSRIGVPISDVRLGYRMKASDGAGLIPARVVERDGQLHLELLRGLSRDDEPETRGNEKLVRPAFVSRSMIEEIVEEERRNNPDFDDLDLNGCEVTAELVRLTHFRRRGRNGPLAEDFRGRYVTALVYESNTGEKRRFEASGKLKEGVRVTARFPTEENLPRVSGEQKTLWVRGADKQTAKGYLFITGRKSARYKHEERLFFTDENDPPTIPIDDRLSNLWRDVITSYLDGNGLRQRDTLKPKDGSQPGVIPAAHLRRVDRRHLTVGQLLYLMPLPNDLGLGDYLPIPVSIARGLYPNAPKDLVPEHSRHITSHDHASSSDRLFGYAADREASVAHRGRIRISRIDTSKVEAMKLDPPVVLPALGSPKPSQFRFYLGKRDEDGVTPISPKLDVKSAFAAESTGGTTQELRGRKFYIHHRNWAQPTGHERTNKNRSISEWIPAGQKFTTHLVVDGARADDLGMLLWLLARETDGAHLRMGMAKPLGFGSVRVSQLKVALATGKSLRQSWLDLTPPPTEIVKFDFDPASGRVEFSDGANSVISAASVGLSSDARRAFETIMSGHAVGNKSPVVSYPFLGDDPSKLGSGEGMEGYQWFMANSKAGKPQSLPLPGTTLTSYPVVEKTSKGGGPRSSGKPGSRDGGGPAGRGPENRQQRPRGNGRGDQRRGGRGGGNRRPER